MKTVNHQLPVYHLRLRGPIAEEYSNEFDWQGFLYYIHRYP